MLLFGEFFFYVDGDSSLYSCPIFIAVSVIKYSDKKQFRRERFYLRSQFQVIVHNSRKVKAIKT